MARYIDADKLLEQVNSLEQLARKRVYDTPTNSPAYERYSTQYGERERMLSIIKAQPTAAVAPMADVIGEYRKRVYAKMEKYTVFGREYMQRIMREVENAMTEGEK